MRHIAILLSAALVLLAPIGAAQAAKAPRSPITEASENAFWSGDFAALERMNAEFKQPGHFDPDGESQLSLFRAGFDNVVEFRDDNAEIYQKEIDALTLQWAREHPDSALAHILHAEALLGHAWSYRGGGYAKDVPPEAWKDFQAYLQQALVYLKEHADVALTDSSAHRMLLRIGMVQGWSHAQMLAIANDGLRRNPNDLSMYFQLELSLLPKWGGDVRALDQYIKATAVQTRERFGMEMYTRLYFMALEDEFGHGLFENTLADWPKMKQGFEDMLVHYPDNPRRLNEYAYTACLAKDRDMLVKLLGRIGSRVRVASWGANPERSLETCKRWADEK
jgi:hypothetical protein